MTHKIKGLILLLMSLLVVAGLAACTPAQSASSPSRVNLSPSPSAGNTPVSTQSPTVSPAALLKKVSGVGTIDVTNYSNLYFGSAGQIETINVQEGDRVTKGTILAKLDTADLEASLAQARVAQDQTQVALAQAQVALDQAYVTQIQANSSLTASQFNLDKIKAVGDIKDAITKLQQQITTAQVNARQDAAAGDTSSQKIMLQYIDNLQAELSRQNKRLATLLNGVEYTGANALTYDIYGQTYDRLVVQDVRMKELAVEAAQKVVDQTASGIAMAQKTIDQAKDGITLAQKNLDLIMKRLDQATISASFDGQVASVNQRAGDFISVPVALQKPVIYLIDPSSFELVIGVNELDVPKVKVGQKATVSIDAFPDIKLNGQVSAISPAPTIRGSIINYDVKITFSVPNDMGVRVGMNAAAEIATN
jgi:HlyD family secretion protein